MPKPIISAIAAIGKNRELGKDGKLIWQIPEDLKHFKEITNNHPVIMGRKTYESIGDPLPNRINIVITRQKGYLANGCEIASSLEEAISIAKAFDSKEIFIIGGAEIYNQAIGLTDKLYLTIVNDTSEADVYFPYFSNFLLIKKETIVSLAGIKLSFCEYSKQMEAKDDN